MLGRGGHSSGASSCGKEAVELGSPVSTRGTLSARFDLGARARSGPQWLSMLEAGNSQVLFMPDESMQVTRVWFSSSVATEMPPAATEVSTEGENRSPC